MRLMRISMCVACLGLVMSLLLASFTSVGIAQGDDPSPPGKVVKLIFIHHSTGENWLMDDYGDLGRTLGENNYFVSDTNYGWGPQAIGDRTDIINWPEWFRSPDSPEYMAALFAESGQNSQYTRWLADPGGENEIILFKSCFPNSNLGGSPDDPPSPGEDLTVGNAKYIYNDLLKYFATRPDKLFEVITAPPLQRPDFPANARAFNTWLVQNWLAENNYPYNNVAVFDFYNVLTHPDNHHRYRDGEIEYITSHGNDTLSYDSDGDDHPNPAGSQKATAEFVPLLNVFYHRWQSGQPLQPVVQATSAPLPVEPTAEAAPVETQPALAVEAPVVGGVVDDFEAGPPEGSAGWEAFWEEGSQTSLTCAPASGVVHTGSAALHANFSVQPGSWATCSLFYNVARDWSSADGLAFYLRASQPALVFDVIAHRGTPESLSTYAFTLETTQEMVADWVYVELPWDRLLRVAWEDEPGAPVDPAHITGVALGFNTYPDAPNVGEIWVDDLALMGAAPSAASPSLPTVQATPASESQGVAQDEGRRMCAGPAAFVAFAAGCLVAARRRI
jgi:hypothetical protein